MVFKILKEKITEHQALLYTVLVLFCIIPLQRLDRLVFWDLGLSDYWLRREWGLVYNFWTFMGLIVLIFSVKDYIIASFFAKNTKVHLVLSMMTGWFIWAGILDIYYLLDVPMPAWLWDINYIWDWSIFYKLFKFPWTIIYQVPWTIAWLVGYYLLYKWSIK